MNEYSWTLSSSRSCPFRLVCHLGSAFRGGDGEGSPLPGRLAKQNHDLKNELTSLHERPKYFKSQRQVAIGWWSCSQKGCPLWDKSDVTVSAGVVGAAGAAGRVRLGGTGRGEGVRSCAWGLVCNMQLWAHTMRSLPDHTNVPSHFVSLSATTLLFHC